MKITPHTRRIIVACMGAMGLTAGIGWAVGTISTNDALLVILPMMTGFFSLLRGES